MVTTYKKYLHLLRNLYRNIYSDLIIKCTKIPISWGVASFILSSFYFIKICAIFLFLPPSSPEYTTPLVRLVIKRLKKAYTPSTNKADPMKMTPPAATKISDQPLCFQRRKRFPQPNDSKKTFFPPDFGGLLLPAYPLKIMIYNPGLLMSPPYPLFSIMYRKLRCAQILMLY